MLAENQFTSLHALFAKLTAIGMSIHLSRSLLMLTCGRADENETKSRSPRNPRTQSGLLGRVNFVKLRLNSMSSYLYSIFEAKLNTHTPLLELLGMRALMVMAREDCDVLPFETCAREDLSADNRKREPTTRFDLHLSGRPPTRNVSQTQGVASGHLDSADISQRHSTAVDVLSSLAALLKGYEYSINYKQPPMTAITHLRTAISSKNMKLAPDNNGILPVTLAKAINEQSSWSCKHASKFGSRVQLVARLIDH